MLLTPEEEGPCRGDYERLARRTPLAPFLPLKGCTPEGDVFFNTDDTAGFGWECLPLNFVAGKSLDLLAGLLRQDYPVDTVIQFMLYPDDHIAPILEEYLRLKQRPDPVMQEAAQRYARHLLEGVAGVEPMRGIPVRNFRLFVTIKAPEVLAPDQVSQFEESLAQAGLSPRRLTVGPLMEFLRRLFNAVVPAHPQAVTSARYLRDQIILAESPVDELPDGVLQIGGRFAACLTPKSTPELFESLDMNRLIGGYSGLADDSNQLLNRFLWTTSIFFRASPAAIRRKANVMMAQRAGGSIAKVIGRRVRELDWVLDDLENNPYVSVITSMWIFGKDADDLNRGVARCRALWEKQNFVMQRETDIALPMLIAALPFGLYIGGQNVETLDRDFPMSTAAAARLLPVQADFAGYMRPVLLYVGRKGQLSQIDVFDPRVNNYNFLVCANSGAGKSFQTNFIVQNYYALGALIRIVDIGYSYQKQAMLSGGRFIDIGDASNRIVLNPFLSAASGDKEDRAANLKTTANIILTMIFSNTGTAAVTETQSSLAKDAVRFACERDGGERGIDHVYEYLKTYPKQAGDLALDGARETAHEMAFNLRDYLSGGVYGAIFNGKATFNIASDPFVVLELERIINDRELFRVISMQVINAITQDLYLSDRSSQRFMLFDEAWKYFSAAPMIAEIIQEGYRRARKYSGSTGIITQSPLDLLKFGPAGDVIKANSAFKFFLESTDYIEAVKRGVLDYEGLLLDLAKSVKNNRPLYSETLFDTPFGAGVGRLCVDRWTYWMNTSSGHEFAQFKKLIGQGLTSVEALTRLAA